MDDFDKHQIAIAMETLRLPDAGDGGMTKVEARQILRDKAGWSKAEILQWEHVRKL